MMTTAVLITGTRDDVEQALRAINLAGGDLPSVELHLDQVLIGHALEDLQTRGHRPTAPLPEPRLDRTLVLELEPGDVRRLRLLDAGDYAHVIAATRRMIHQHLDALIASPECPHCPV